MYMPRIDQKKCELSKECLTICPVYVYEVVDNEMAVVNPGDCIGCEACSDACPHGAIVVEPI
jgi:NAD-dependent dihydropyrimidine dehydrogenase PreA subunit